MSYEAIVSGENGEATIGPFPKRTPEKSYRTNEIIIEEFKINTQKDNAWIIPKHVFEKYGYLRKDGKFAFAVNFQWRKVKSKYTLVGIIYKFGDISELLETVEHNDRLVYDDNYRLMIHDGRPQDKDDILPKYTEAELAYREHMSEFHGWSMP